MDKEHTLDDVHNGMCYSPENGCDWRQLYWANQITCRNTNICFLSFLIHEFYKLHKIAICICKLKAEVKLLGEQRALTGGDVGRKGRVGDYGRNMFNS